MSESAFVGDSASSSRLFQRTTSVTNCSASSLPEDVLVAIFLIARDIEDAHFREAYPTILWPPFPLRISHVCVGWRAIALCTPMIWTSLHFFPPWRLDIVRLFLDRSQACPIDIQLTATKDVWGGRGNAPDSKPSYSEPNEGDMALYKMIEDHLPRCRRLSIEGDEPTLFPDFIAIQREMLNFHGPLPLLRSLSLVEERYVTGPVVGPIFPGGTPALTHLIRGTGFGGSLSSYTTLTSLHLRLDYLHFQDLHGVLSQCHRLEIFATYDNIIDVFPHDMVHAADLPFLSSLQLYGSGNVSEFLCYISAPRLKHLVIDELLRGDLDPLFFSPRLVNGSYGFPEIFPALRSITLSFSAQSQFQGLRQAFTLVLEYFRDVEEATLVGTGASDVLDFMFKDPPLPEPLNWPRLQTLALRTPIKPAYVAARERLGIPLRRIIFSKEALAAQQDLIWLKERLEIVELDVWDDLRAAGMYYPYEQFGA